MMDRLAQSPLRLATLQRKKTKKYRPSVAQESEDAEESGLRESGGSRKRRLAPLCTGSRPPTEKTRTAYEAALQQRDFQKILWMITNGDMPAGYETFGGETAFLAAIGARNVNAFRLIAQCDGISVNDRNRHGYTPLMKAIAAAAPFAEASHNDAKPKQLHKPPKQPSRKAPTQPNNNVDGVTTPHANDHGREDVFDNCMVECVLGLLPDLHARDAAGQAAFDWAKSLGNREAVAMMQVHQHQLKLQHADFEDRDSRLRECVELLRRHDAIAAEMETLLRIPLLQEAQLVRFVKETPPDLSEFNVTNALLDYESITSHGKSASETFVDDYFLNRETRDGWTPLTKAAACGFIEAVRMLLAVGVDVLHESSRLKHSALSWASCCGHEGVVLLLLREASALLHHQTREGKTALMHAVSNQQLVVTRHLLHAMHEYSVRRASGKETFHFNENAIRLHNSAKRRPTRWGGRPVSTPPGSKRKPGTAEWHEVFLEMLRVQDKSGRDAQCYAKLLEPTSESAAAVQRELQHALAQALDHQAYVATHMSLTLPTMCKYARDGCEFMAPLDLLPTHELHECTKRRIDCERCGESIAHDERVAHDQVSCEERVVPCANRQHGCEALLVWRDREAHERDHCRKRLVECRLVCDRVDGQLKYDERDAHETTQCVLRLVECSRKCGAPPFPANQSGKHKRMQCVKRLIKCTGGRTGTGGCGLDVAVDEMDFHVVNLCETRRIPCKWSHHGCTTWIGGAADCRRHHEDAECPFRLVDCKNSGCNMSGQLLACFLDEHYAWQCSFEPKQCPNMCNEGELMAAHWLDAHTLSDAGGCLERLTHCRLDLCGKTLRLFDCQKDVGAARLTSDVVAAGDDARLSMRALKQRIDRATAFLEKLKQRQDQASTGDSHEDNEGIDEAHEEGEADFWHTRVTRQVLLAWLEPLHVQLQDEWSALVTQKQERSLLVRVLSFNGDTSLHMVEFQRDGRCEWMELTKREYDVLLPMDKSESAAAKSGQNAAAFSFHCDLIVASSLPDHETRDCGLRLVSCPLACGQRLTSQSISQHLSKRCNLRNAKCRLGCGAVLPFLQLSEHEDAVCELRQTHCEHCYEAMAHRTLAVHLTKQCPQLPRRCRFGCAAKIPSAQFAVHETEECPKRLVPCPQCEKLVWFCEQEAHASEECALRVFGSCDAGCGHTLRVNERAYHLLYDCTMRNLPCPQCKEVVVWKDLSQHKQLLCRQRDVYCRRGCGQKLKEIDSASHEADECEKRIVDCTNRCGEQVPFADIHAHESLQCAMRVVQCPHGCGEKLFAYQCETHWKRCRQRLCECGAGSKHCARPIRLWISQRRLVSCKTHQESGLLWALKTQDEDLVAYFLQSIDHDDEQSGVNTEFANGFTALSLAASLKNLDIAKMLLRAGADVNQETSRGRSPLMEATMAHDPDMVALLLENRASVSHVNRHGVGVLSVAESFAASDASEDSSAQRILKLLRVRDELENDQRTLFTAIACSDYDYVAQLLKYSSGMAGATLAELEQQVQEKQQAFDDVKGDLDESVKLLNESIADTEAKTTHSQRMRERVEACKSQIATIESFHEASLADSNALEAEMLSHIREITAIDIAKLLNTNTPPAEYLVVMKSICLFCGVMPRGRRNASEYSDLEWWKTAQALLMDRSLLSKLRGFRNQQITPDVMNKVRRECMRTQAFATSTRAFEGLSMNGFTPQEDGYRMVQKIPRRDAIRGDIVGILATWVRGVELEYKAKTVRQTLSEKKRRLAVSLNVDDDGLTTAIFEMKVATRSLPARQEEVQVVETKVEAAERQLTAAKQKLRAFKLLQYAALNGHTALSFASAVGNEAMVHMLLASGASAGLLPEELHACAALIQLMFREFLFRTKQTKTQTRSRSDAAMEALVRNVAQTLLLGHFRRKRRYIQLTHRVPIHEAVYNGHPQILEILLANGQAKLWHKTHMFPIQVVPGSVSLVKAERKSALELRRRGGWQLVPLTGMRPEDDETEKDSSVAKLVDPRDLEERLAPLTLEETLLHAQWKCDSRTFLRDSGGWNHSATKLTTTAEFVGKSMARLRELQATQQREIRARKDVAKKTREHQALHARLDAAIVRRDFHAIFELLDEGAFADYETTKDGLTPLMAACVEETYVLNGDGKSVLAVEYLMDRPTNHPFVNFESSTGRTALSVAAFHGTTLCAQELVERGANVNLATRKHGETALMAAASNGQTAFVEYLLHHRETDVFHKDFDGNTAFEYAKKGGFHDAQHVLGAAMSGGNRGRVFASTSALYGVCKWGCGFMTPTTGHEIGLPSSGVHSVAVVEDTQPLAEHERSSCPKRIVECPNKCGQETLWAESMELHLKSECVLRRVPCPQAKCGALVVYNQLPVHSTTQCEFRMVLCECGERMTHQKHVLHTRNQCSERLVPCPLQCRVTGSTEVTLVKFGELKDHERSQCLHRSVRCRNGCVASELKFKDRELHETQLCVLRRVQCKWGCEEPVFANAQLHHESDECLVRMLPCPNKCGGSVQFLSLEDHVSVACTRRLTICTLGCGRKVPLHLMATHVASECRRRVVQCELCGQELLETDLAAHQKSQCTHRLSVCGLCGQSDIPLTHMASHRSDDCRMRVASCRFSCYATRPLLAHQKLHHEQFECAFRPIFCPLGCGQTIVAHTLKKHEKACEMRIVSCGNGCGVELREKEREDHERRYCSAGAKALQRGRLI